MPKYTAPHKAGVHRVAGIALFRALLRGCNRLQLDNSVQAICRNVIRNRFKRNRLNQSKVELEKAFSAGYEALRLLHSSAAGSLPATTRITTLLAHSPSHLRKPPPPSPLLPPPRTPKYPPLNPDSSAILSRPRPVVSGTRHVPILTFAGAYPFLRLKKPQPHTLGAYLRRKINKRFARHQAVERLEGELKIARWEDEWDWEVGCREEVVGWEEAAEEGLRETWALIRRDANRAVELYRGMEGVVEREREMVEREKEEAVEGGLRENRVVEKGEKEGVVEVGEAVERGLDDEERDEED